MRTQRPRLYGGAQCCFDFAASGVWVRADSDLMDFEALCLRRLALETKDRREFDAVHFQKYDFFGAVVMLQLSNTSVIIDKRGIFHYLSLLVKMREQAALVFGEHRGRFVKLEYNKLYFVFDDCNDVIAV